VNWVVLTDGDEYRIYKAHEPVPVEDKLFKQVRISDGEGVEQTLMRLSKGQLSTLEEFWKDSDADRKVREAIDALLTPPGDAKLIGWIRSQFPTLGREPIRQAIARIPRPWPAATVPSAVRSAAPGPGTAEHSRRKRARKVRAEASLADLVAAGLIHLPADLEASYKGKRLTARIAPDHTVVFDGRPCTSLSTAAAMARASVIGRRPDGRDRATNGWTFWRTRDADGNLMPVDRLRGRAARSE
jgi:Restriction Enzyme Adenine Methylase Associated